MKALSLSRPWDYTFLHLGKRIENRKLKSGRMPPMCKHRGELYLHTAQSWNSWAAEWMAERGLLPDLTTKFQLAAKPPRASGRIFARCSVVGHIEPTPNDSRPTIVLDAPEAVDLVNVRDEFDDRIVVTRDVDRVPLGMSLDLRWWMGGHAMVFDDEIAPIDPVECDGALGLWTPPAEVLVQLGAAA